MQPEVEVLVQDFEGKAAAVSGVEGSISRGAKGNAKPIKFVSKGQGSFKASLTGLDVSLGTYRCASCLFFYPNRCPGFMHAKHEQC